jgi:hypothetical protein
VDFDVDELLIIYSAFIRYWKKRKGEQWDVTSVTYRLHRRPLSHSGEKYYTLFSLSFLYL